MQTRNCKSEGFTKAYKPHLAFELQVKYLPFPKLSVFMFIKDKIIISLQKRWQYLSKIVTVSKAASVLVTTIGQVLFSVPEDE